MAKILWREETSDFLELEAKVHITREVFKMLNLYTFFVYISSFLLLISY